MKFGLIPGNRHQLLRHYSKVLCRSEAAPADTRCQVQSLSGFRNWKGVYRGVS